MATFESHASPSGAPLGAPGAFPSVHDGQPGRVFDAAVFDMDGVITRTAGVHALAWKQMFDEYLRYRAERAHEALREFTRQDYLTFVDGRPRYQGVESFLTSRGIVLPAGSPLDRPGTETICGLGNAKNAEFNRIVAREGVAVFPSTVALLLELSRRGILLGVATSSRNSGPILQQSGTMPLFATVVDGIVSEQRQLEGKPAPDIFLAACRDLRVPPARAIVIEDAVSGVQAGAKGGFALVIGVARENNSRELRENGADLVVRDLAELTVDEIGRRIQARRTAAP